MKTLALASKDERKIHEKQATDDVKAEKERKWEKDPSANLEAVNPESERPEVLS